jgi:SagB-type dehydrogenase family enzyme
MLAHDDATTLALLYHLNSAVWTNAEAYAEPHLPHYREAEGETVALPPQNGESPLGELIARRRSCRAFAPVHLGAEALGGILHAAYGIVDRTEPTPGWGLFRRAVPSAGGLYPLDVYVAAERVDGVADGVYRYVPVAHELERVSAAAPPAALRAQLLQPELTRNANALIFVTAEFARTLSKYGPRGYRYVLLECGHVAENVCLASAERGLDTLCMGGFSDDGVNGALGLDGAQHAAIYAVAVGRGDPG